MATLVITRQLLRGDAQAGQLAHLVMDEADQRRHHHRDPALDHGRQLVAEGLAAPGRHQHEGVVAQQRAVDGLQLVCPVALDAELFPHELSGPGTVREGLAVEARVCAVIPRSRHKVVPLTRDLRCRG